MGEVFCIHVSQDLTARCVEYNSRSNVESVYYELNFRKRKWLATAIHKPSSSENAFIKSLFSCLTNVAKEFRNIVLPGDFNMTAKILKRNHYLIHSPWNV